MSKINFDIAPKKTLLSDNNYSEELNRKADVYVFCVLSHQNQETINPINVEQWDFYLVLTKTLTQKLGKQKTLSLSALEKKLKPIKSDFKNLKNNFDQLVIAFNLNKDIEQ